MKHFLLILSLVLTACPQMPAPTPVILTPTVAPTVAPTAKPASVSLSAASEKQTIVVGIPAVFSGIAENVATVAISMDAWPLGSVTIQDGKFSLKYALMTARNSRTLHLVGLNEIGKEVVRRDYVFDVIEAPKKDPIMWSPVPAEDAANGKNDNAYLPAIGHPTEAEATAYIAEISGYAKKYATPAGIPASVIVAMAANESGFGYTRVGYNSNSIFSQKNWGCAWKSRFSNSCYALVGQPDEWDGQIKILKKTAKGVVYDETNRPDNKYFGFPSREVAVQSLVQEWLVEGQFPPYQKGKYSQTITTYKENISKGMSRYDAAIFFVRQLADLGYMHLGGDVYVSHLKPIIDKYNLTKLDGANVAFAGWQTYITDERRQTQQLPNQIYAILPNEIKQNWAYVFCPWWFGKSNVPSEPKNILLFGNYTGFQDANVYPEWAIERHNKTLACLETVFKEHAKTKNIVLQTTQGDSTNAEFSLKVRKIVQEKQDALTAKYAVKPAIITYGADEQAAVGMAYTIDQKTPVDVIVSNPLARQHYDGDRTAQELIAAKLPDLGMVQTKGEALKILVLTRRPGAENTDFQANDLEQAKFDAAFFEKNPITASTIVVDSRLYNGAWDARSAPKRCDYLAYGAWGTFENAFGSTAAIGKILHKLQADPETRKKLILEAVGHDAFFQGYEEVQRNAAFHALLKAGNGIFPYDHWNDQPWDKAKNSYTVMNKYVNKRMQEHFTGTDCMKGKTLTLTPQRPALFEAISEVK